MNEDVQKSRGNRLNEKRYKLRKEKEVYYLIEKELMNMYKKPEGTD